MYKTLRSMFEVPEFLLYEACLVSVPAYDAPEIWNDLPDDVHPSTFSSTLQRS